MRGEPRAGARKPGAASRFVAVLALCLFAILGLGITTAQGAGGESRPAIVVHAVHSSPHPRAFWTAKRIRQAEPLSLVTLSKPGGRVVDAGGASPAAADPSADGTDSGDPTHYPNSANGVVLFKYGSSLYRCSGSVINTSAGNVVLTAGHCVIQPGSGTNATNIVFIPGYRDGAHTFGDWPATTFATTTEWQTTAGTGDPNDADEAGDMAMLTLANRPSDSATVQSIVGAVGIAFNQPRLQTYMEYGYPAGPPYDGTRLYALTAPWAVDDPSFSPHPMGISSDFTGGSSGGPWLVGSSPEAMSVTDYKYLGGPLVNYMFGPYFGSIAQNLFVSVGGSASGSSATGTITGATSPASGTISPASVPSNAFGIELLSRNRHRGVVVLGVKVPGEGRVDLSGDGLRAVSKQATGTSTVGLRVRAKGFALATLRDAGRILVQATIAYTPSGGSANSKIRSVVLLKHP
jgi:V8-like Glu-specific endopeptidase